MKDKIIIKLELEKYISKAGGDVDNLECDCCKGSCQRTKEVWYMCDLESTLLALCPGCAKKLSKESEVI